MEKYFKLLEFDQIREMLAAFALSENAKAKALALMPTASVHEAEARMNETGEARDIIERFGQPPVAGASKIGYFLELAEKGAMLVPEQLSAAAGFLLTCGKMKRYLQKAQDVFIDLAFIGNTLNPLEHVTNDILNAIRDTEIDDRASQELREIRKRKNLISEKIKEKLNSMLKGNKPWFADTYITMRGGRLTLPVKKEHKSRVPGIVVDVSQTGGTCFIEPDQVRVLRDEVNTLEIHEENEVRRILYALSGMLAGEACALRMNIEAMEQLDFMFAKAKLSLRMNACRADIQDAAPIIIIKNGRHPLLSGDSVPLNFEIGGGIRSVVITGPNTGGKTVALKTVGLLSLMAQSGLHVPADPGSRFSIQDLVACDIGDGQSISENLSTFSSHMVNIIDILSAATPASLVLLDELGSGTDPAEGMGLAVAVLEALAGRRCLVVATTHYPEIKAFAKTAPGFVNARMAFDRESLKPLYTLIIGEAGESCALHIAKRLGMPQTVLERASRLAGSETRPTDIPAPMVPQSSTAVHNNTSPRRTAHVSGSGTGSKHSARFALGDSVIVYPKRDIGIVYARADAKGMLGVIIKGVKTHVSHKRVKLHVAAKELYPDDYDFSIVVDSVAVRKAHKLMDKRHVDGLVIRED